MDAINSVISKRKEDEDLATDLTRIDIIKCIQSEKVRFRGVNLSGLDLSKLVIFHNLVLEITVLVLEIKIMKILL